MTLERNAFAVAPLAIVGDPPINRTSRLLIAVCAIVILAGFSTTADPAAAQPATGGTGKCEALSDFLILNAIVHVPIDPFEARIQLRNVSGGRLRIDPKMFTLGNWDLTVRLAPLTLDETLALIRNPVQIVVGAVRSGLTGLVDSIDSQRRWAIYAEASILKTGRPGSGSYCDRLPVLAGRTQSLGPGCFGVDEPQERSR